MRGILKMYRNGKGGAWTHRIRWYEEGDGVNIRLAIDHPDGKNNLFPKSEEEAQAIWDEFKNKYPMPGGRQGRARFGR